MKIEEKKLRTWGSAALLLGILPLVFLVLRDHQGFDQANIILFDLSGSELLLMNSNVFLANFLINKETIMGRPKINHEDKKGKLGISISKVLIEKINRETNNKSTFIEMLITEYFDKK